MEKETIRKKYYENKEYYEMMEEWHKERGGIAIEPVGKHLIEKVCSEISSKSGSVVLELGCGEGSITLYFAKKFSNINFIGTDISKYSVELALKKSTGLKNVKFLQDDIQKSCLLKESADFIILQSVLEHLIDYKKGLEECYRILKTGGYLYIRVGNGGRTENLLKDIVRYLFKLNKPIFNNPNFDLSGHTKNEKRLKHQKNFDFVEIPSDVLVSDLKSIGFKIVYFTTYKEAVLMSYKYKNANFIKRTIYNFFVHLNIFPFNHLGRTIVVLCKK